MGDVSGLFEEAVSVLSSREREVLRRIAEGESTKQIARGLRISPATVRAHVRSMFLKLGVRTRAQAAALLAPCPPHPHISILCPAEADGARHLAPTPAPFDALTRREAEVLRCMAAGLPRIAIAERLALSPNTVRTHIRNVLAKLGVNSSLAAGALLRSAIWAPRT